MAQENSDRPVRLMLTLAVRGPFERVIIPRFEAESGRTIAADWSPTTVILRALAAGTPADALVVTADAMDGLAAEGRIDPASRIDVVRSRVGLAVPPGAAHPDIATVPAFTQALLAARSVAYSVAGASGIHFRAVLDQLGIAEAVNAKATIIPTGFTAETLLTGQADLAVQQVSELMVVPGVEVIGPLPDAVQQVGTFSAAILTGATDRDGAARFLAQLGDETAREAFRAGGLEPAGGLRR